METFILILGVFFFFFAMYLYTEIPAKKKRTFVYEHTSWCYCFDARGFGRHLPLENYIEIYQNIVEEKYHILPEEEKILKEFVEIFIKILPKMYFTSNRSQDKTSNLITEFFDTFKLRELSLLTDEDFFKFILYKIFYANPFDINITLRDKKYLIVYYKILHIAYSSCQNNNIIKKHGFDSPDSYVTKNIDELID